MQLVPFESAQLPAHFRKATTNKMVSAASQGFPVISIKGKVFHIVRGGERTLITKPGEDDPAASLEVVVLDLNAHNSKVFYATGYTDGSDAKPTCYSNNGLKPEADAESPQAKTCAACVHNQWGSRITQQGGKGKACADSRRMAIATPDTPADPMLVRVPAASLKAMGEYGKLIAARGCEPHQVITRIGFDYSVAHPALTFKPVAIITDPNAAAEIEEARKADVVKQITGEAVAPTQEAAEDAPVAAVAPTPAPAPVQAAPVAQAAPAPRPAAKAAPSPAAAAAKAASFAAATPKVEVQVEAAPAPAPVVVAQDTSGLESQITDLIDGMNFDD